MHLTEYYSTLKSNEIRTCYAWLNLGDIILSEINQSHTHPTQKALYDSTNEVSMVVKSIEAEWRTGVPEAGGGRVGSCLMGTVSLLQAEKRSGDLWHSNMKILSPTEVSNEKWLKW